MSQTQKPEKLNHTIVSERFCLEYFFKSPIIWALEEKVDFIKNIGNFKHLNNDVWTMIANRFEVIEIARNEVIYKQGEDVNQFFIIVNGKNDYFSLYFKKSLYLGSAVAKKEGSTSADRTFIRGEFFGLTPVFFGRKAKATITATTHSVCLSMTKQSIEEIIVSILREIERISSSYGDFIKCL